MRLKKICDPDTFALLLEFAEQEFLVQLPDYRNWYPLLGRFHCFHSLLLELKGIHRTTPECRTSESRLIQLLKQAMLYQLSVIQTQVGQEVRVEEIFKGTLPILRNVVYDPESQKKRVDHTVLFENPAMYHTPPRRDPFLGRSPVEPGWLRKQRKKSYDLETGFPRMQQQHTISDRDRGGKRVPLTWEISPDNPKFQRSQHRCGFQPCGWAKESQPVRSACYSPQGDILAFGSSVGSITVVDSSWSDIPLLNDSEPRIPDLPAVWRRLSQHEGAVNAIHFNSDASVLASAGDDSIRLQHFRVEENPVSDTSPAVLEGHDGEVMDFRFIDDNTIVSAGSGTYGVYIWDLPTKSTKSVLRAHSGTVYAVDTSGSMIATGSGDKTVRLWDLRTKEVPSATLDSYASKISTVSLYEKETSVVVGYHDGGLLFWDYRMISIVWQSTVHVDDVRSVQLSPDNQLILSGSADTGLAILDGQNGGQVAVIAGAHRDTVTVVRWNPQRAEFLSCGEDATVYVWRTLF